jgi:hypothetical protein
MDQDFTFMKRAEINPDRLGTVSVSHVLIDSTGSHTFSAFVRLEIARNGADGGYYLFHICADGSGTDTWHGTLEDALDQAEAEFGVITEDWKDIA